jgi:hypothetical protein
MQRKSGYKYFSKELGEKVRRQRLNEVVTVTCARCGKSRRAKLGVTNEWFTRHREICRGR